MLSVDGGEAETNIRQRGDVGGSAKKVGKRIKELERIYGVREGSLNEKGNNRIGEPNNSGDQITQSDIAAQMGISVDTLQNYKMMAEMIPELEDLMDTGIVIKTTALAKQRKVAVEYVRLCGYSPNGDRSTECQLGTRITLDEIATQLGTTKRSLQRALSIERNLTDSMKELLDTGIVTKIRQCRNLTPIQRIAIAERKRDYYEKKAKENQSEAGKQFGIGHEKLLTNSAKAISQNDKINVRAKLAETAGVSQDTYSKGKKILDSNNEEVKQKVMSGEMSINAGYNKIIVTHKQSISFQFS